MRRIRYSVAMSLDGFIAGPEGEYDWIPNEPEIDWTAFMDRFDTALMGRRSYDAARSMPGAMPKMPVYVFSRTMRQQDHPKVTVVRDRVDETIAELRAKPGKEIWLFGGGDLFRSLLSRGFVDVIEIGLVPILLGKGIRFLTESASSVHLKLTDTHRYPSSGIVMLTYEVVR